MNIDDMSGAIEWLRHYEADPEDPNGLRCARVADWLEAEMKRRIESIAVRRLAQECGASPAAIKVALKRKRAA